MPEKHYPGETVGIIGSSIHAALLAQAAGKLGYRVASLVLNPENLVRQFATWQTVAEAYDEATLRFFAGRIDTVIVEPGLLSNLAFKVLADITDVSLSEDLRAIATDRLIEKAYLDEKRCLVAPFAMVTSLEDVKEAVEFIGFPCYLKYTQRHIEAVSNHLILYSEADYEVAQAKIALGTCILEAWIPSEKVVSLSVVRNERGELHTAQRLQKQYGVLASVSLAQAMVESDFGQSQLAANYYNLFGVKAEAGDPDGVDLETKEFVNNEWVTIVDRFKVYKSWEDSLIKHAELIFYGTSWNAKQYQAVLEAKDYQSQARGLQSSGYATDPDYAEKLIAMIEEWQLTQYDQ